MFWKKKKAEIVKDNCYSMIDEYDSSNLVVGNLQYLSSKIDSGGPSLRTTRQKYIFEKIEQDGKTMYREVFTGFVADSEESNCFDLPYVISIIPLEEKMPSVAKRIPKYGLLLVVNEINKQRHKNRNKRNDRNLDFA